MKGVLLMSLAASLGMAAALPDLVITSLPGKNGAAPAALQPGDVTVLEGKTPAPVVRMTRLEGNLAGMELFVLLDDSTRTSSLGLQLADLKKFIAELPPTTAVGVGYMRFGAFQLAQGFTADHQLAAKSLRLSQGEPGENGSPYFALQDLVKRWPSNAPANRRAVLMLSDGVDLYWGSSIPDDPYEDNAIRDALKHGVMVYTIYLRDAGRYDRRGWPTLMGQSHLTQVAEETGGYAYFQDFSDPVTIAPFLKDLQMRLENQYQVTIQPGKDKGVQPVKLKTESPGTKVTGPTRVYVQ